MHYKKSNQSAAILIISLWILVILSIFSLSLAHRMSIELKLNKFYRDRTKVFYLAKAGIKKLIAELKKDTNEPPNNYDSLNERWSSGKDDNGEYLFKDIALGDGIFSISYIFGYENEEPIYFYGASDEEQRINVNTSINTGQENLLLYLFENLGIDTSEAQILSDSIKDWIDNENPAITRDHGAEDYSEPVSYKPRNGPVTAIEELRLVRGMTDENFNKIQDYLTTFGSGTVNINSISGIMLQSLFMNLDCDKNYGVGFSQSLAEKIITARRGNDGDDGTEDDAIFIIQDSTISIVVSGTTLDPDHVADFLKLDDNETAAFSKLVTSGLISTQSAYYRIHSTGTTKDGKIKKEIEAVVKKDEDKIVFWHEN